MSKLSRATFGLGWFWDVESQFGCQPGVVITRVGYAGGDTQSPTYYKLGDHTEVVDVFFDPDITSYEALLSYYFSHLGQKTATSRQYRSVIMCHNSDQLALAKSLLQEKHLGKCEVSCEPFKNFYIAEKKHQKNALKRHPGLFKCLAWEEDLTHSFVATRLNGYIGGNGSMAKFNKEWENLGLSKKIVEYVRKVIIKRCWWHRKIY